MTEVSPTASQVIDLEVLERVARAATPQDLSTAELECVSTIICPLCDGDGEVTTKDYTNYDNVAIGVQFFGVGNEHVHAEQYFEAAKPATILALVAAVKAARAFADKVVECQPHIDGAFAHQFIRGIQYSGPQYGEEQLALRAALEQFKVSP